VPFKGGPQAKSRLQAHGWPGALGAGFRLELALGFLADTVSAAAAAPSVRNIVIVSSDPAATICGPKIRMLADPGEGLNAAVEAGFAFARSLSSVDPVAALTADLPCLTAVDLEFALERAGHHPLVVVPDRHGTGTTMISALPGVSVRPRFGHRSRAAHLTAGHNLLPIPQDSTLRADVDTIEDLAAAIRIGVGDHTRAALRASGLILPDPPPGGGGRLPSPSDNLTPQRKSCPAS
jgi:2-phospho-L-lactate guanylyltransferase